jgi:hypothetical protein
VNGASHLRHEPEGRSGEQPRYDSGPGLSAEEQRHARQQHGMTVPAVDA